MLLLERHFLRHVLYARFGRQSLDYPLMGYIYLTYRCNLACTYCNDGQGVKYPQKQIDRELTFDEWIELFRALRRSIDMLILTGGEPYCRDDLAEILRAVRGMGYRMVCVLTNGLNLDEQTDTLDRIDRLMISLDTMDHGRGDRMLGRPGVHRRIVRNVQLAAGLRRRKRFKLQLNVCITPENVADAHDVIDFALEHNIGFAAVPEIRGFYPADGLVENAEYEALIRRILDLKRRGCDVAGSMLYNQGIRRFDDYRCQPTLLARVRPNGDLIYPCNKRDTAGGNLLQTADYGAAVEQGSRLHGPVPDCDNRCHAGCYMDFSLLVQKPWWLLHELYLALVRRPFFSRARRRAGARYPSCRPG